jgi:hypothetical protein
VREVVTEYFPVAQVVEEDRMVVLRLHRDHDHLAVWTTEAYDFDFAPTAPRFFLARGWWPSEWAGSVGMAWSHGRESILGFFLPEARAMTMELRVTPMPVPFAPPQSMAISVNNRPLGQFELTRGPDAAYSLEIPAGAVTAGFNTFPLRMRTRVFPTTSFPGILTRATWRSPSAASPSGAWSASIGAHTP